MRTLALIAFVAAASAGADSRRSLRSREQQQFLVPLAAASPAPPAPTDLTTAFTYMSGVISQTGNKATELVGTVAGKVVEGVNALPATVWSTFADTFKQFMDEYGRLPKSINAAILVVQVDRYTKLEGSDKAAGEKMKAAADAIVRDAVIKDGITLAMQAADVSIKGASHGASIALRAAVEAYNANKSIFDGLGFPDSTAICKDVKVIQDESSRLTSPAKGEVMEELAAIKAGIETLKKQLGCPA